jgi:CheY-like chemotaxis protein
MPQTLLLADDSVTIQRVIELTFADEDIIVVAVSDGDQAISRIDANPPDIVLADIGMPGRNGYEVAQHVKQTPALQHIPVILLTGAFEPVDQARASEAGCDGVLAKPFEPQLVIARVRELLEKARYAPRPSEPFAPAEPPAREPFTGEPFGSAANEPAGGAPFSSEPVGDEPTRLFGRPFGGDAPQAPSSFVSQSPSPFAAPSPFAPAAPPESDDSERPAGASSAVWPSSMFGSASATEPPPAPAPPPGEDREKISRLDSYFEELDAAFASRVDTPAPAPARSASEAMDWLGSAEARTPAPEPDLPLSLLPPTETVRTESLEPPAAAEAPPAADAPETPLTQAMLPPLADAFAAILAAEQHDQMPVASIWGTPPSNGHGISEDVIEQITRRVLERLSDEVVRRAVSDVVSGIAEQLVRAEIERIKSSIK